MGSSDEIELTDTYNYTHSDMDTHSYGYNHSELDTYTYYPDMYGNDTAFVSTPLIKQPIHMIIIYSIAYGLIFIFAVIGNSLVIAVIYKDRSMRNVTNYFIINMAVADLMVALLIVPITLLANIYSGWRFGGFLCKITPYVQGVVQCASVNTLAAIAIDRYLAICYSRHSKISACACRTTILSIWVFASTIMAPLLVYYQKYNHPEYIDVPMCHQLWPNFNLQRGYFLVALFILCYLLPLIMIMVCYLLIAVKICNRNAPGVQTHGRLLIYKSKVKVLKMLAVIVLLFAFSWLPLYAVYIKLYYASENIDAATINVIYEIIVPFAQWLGSSNSGMNPVIYSFFSKKYRRGFRNILSCRMIHFRFRRRSRHTQSMSTRYVNVDSSAVHNGGSKHDKKHDHRVSSNKFMVVAVCNGKMTVSFRRENGSDESSF